MVDLALSSNVALRANNTLGEAAPQSALDSQGVAAFPPGELHMMPQRTSFRVIAYNAQSILCEDRFDALIEDLSDVPWDMLVLTETWREAKVESWQTVAGHVFWWRRH